MFYKKELLKLLGAAIRYQKLDVLLKLHKLAQRIIKTLWYVLYNSFFVCAQSCVNTK